MPGLTIEPAADAEVPAYLQLRDAAAEELVAQGIVQWRPGELTPQVLVDWLGDGTLYAAKLDGELVGGLMVMWADWFWDDEGDGTAGYTHGLLVAREHKGTGLGGQLLTFAEETIRSTGRRLSRLDTVTTNHRLRRYYREAGYDEVGEKVFDGGKVFETGAPVNAVILFEKKLT